jgi:hypothetical protein
MEDQYSKATVLSAEIEKVVKGMSVDVASDYVGKNYPEYRIAVIKPNQMITCDIAFNRIRLFVTAENIIERISVAY